ncbi:hypothetical protein KAZ66_01045 [Candidatus Woesebacteria bacterium]|nr:hypothetical protein [Candidatus Woesebacteria bacterium]
MLNQNKLRIDFIIVLGMVLAFIPLILFFEVRFLTSTILFFAIPALYLFIRKPKQIKRLAASLVAGMIVAFIVDFLAELNGAWSWAPVGQLVFPNMLFGLIPIDVLIWYFFWLLLTIVYYEHFFEHEKTKKVSKLFKKAVSFFALLLILVISVFYLNADFLRFPYAYFVIGFLGALPFFYLIARKPHLVGKLLKAGLFNIFLFLSFELTALSLDQWRFPGEYIGSIQLFGLVFPFEEFVFWIVLGTPIILSYYEIFIDDDK